MRIILDVGPSCPSLGGTLFLFCFQGGSCATISGEAVGLGLTGDSPGAAPVGPGCGGLAGGGMATGLIPIDLAVLKASMKVVVQAGGSPGGGAGGCKAAIPGMGPGGGGGIPILGVVCIKLGPATLEG